MPKFNSYIFMINSGLPQRPLIYFDVIKYISSLKLSIKILYVLYIPCGSYELTYLNQRIRRMSWFEKLHVRLFDITYINCK